MCIDKLDQLNNQIKKLEIEKKLLKIDSSIIYAINRNLLIENVASIIINAGYRAVWFGKLDFETKKVYPRYCTGIYSENLCKEINIYDENIDHPAKEAILTGKYLLYTDIKNKDYDKELKKRAVDFNYDNLISIPIITKDWFLSVVVIYADNPIYFSDNILKTLLKMVDNIGFGLESLRIREQHLIDREEKIVLSQAIRYLSEAVLISNYDGDIIYSNSALDKFLKKSLRDNFDIKKSTVFDLFKKWIDIKVTNKIFEDVKKDRFWSGEIYIDGIDNGGIYIKISISTILNYSNSIKNYVFIIKDITDEKLQNIKLEHSHRMESMGNLAGGIAHDFNNILTAIMGYSEILKDELKESETIGYLEQILFSTNRAKELVKQILSFSYKKDKKLKPVYVENVAKEVIKLLKSALPGIDIYFYPLKTGEPVLADSTQIYQIIMNLSTNAAHSMKEKGGILQITLDHTFIKNSVTLTDGKYLLLKVQDSGEGIEKSKLDKIFEPYFTTKKKGDGTGLGLAIVDKIIKSYKGEIKVESELNRGTTFYIYIPICKKDIEEKIMTNYFDIERSVEILFLDDEKILASLGKKMLEKMGYNADFKTDSIEALEFIKNNPNRFKIIITDQTMPNLTGIEFAKKVQDINKDIDIVLCTGYNDSDIIDDAKESGIKYFLPKPFVKKDIENLFYKIFNH